MKKLKLEKSTIRTLVSEDLRHARGGGPADTNLRTFRTACFGVCDVSHGAGCV